ncbi:class I SAM-dependent methyltransferase [Pseudoxanthomonas sp. GM95]|uniref:class I SAM-dependent DNA methyltransferase n=1 Tax=Pseudoxanthomonas sp. GM95 TaxID=1881043 RepID=UPI0020C8A500|nr:class I SAM-dependent methyltransferase [Pseudoxanthomonas sp. GM95]
MQTEIPSAAYFEQIHANGDPFGYRSRWYEARKRQVLLATLPKPNFERAWELGCSNGELTAALSERCSSLLATDISNRAVQLARQRTQQLAGVSVEQMTHPSQWPTGSFALIVMSEVGYYMTPAALHETIEKLQDALQPGGVLVACHWLHPFAGAPQNGRQVHARIAEILGSLPTYAYEDRDFVLEAWGGGEASIAELEGLR